MIILSWTPVSKKVWSSPENPDYEIRKSGGKQWRPFFRDHPIAPGSCLSKARRAAYIHVKAQK